MGHLSSLTRAEKESVLGALEAAGCTTEEFLSIGSDPEIARLAYAATLPRGMSTEAQVARILRWYRLYADIHLTTERVMAVLPERESEFDRLVWMAGGMKPNRCYDVLGRQFGSGVMWRMIHDLDNSIVSVRSTDKDYAVWVRDRLEADEENSNRRAKDFEQSDCQTVEERLVHGGLYFQEHHRHLDEFSKTLCAGSRSRLRGGVSSVNFHPIDRRVYVFDDWCNVRERHPDLRVRSVRRRKKDS